ncbi:type II toxin-antitoxin system RelE/ParE family toxin [Endozoicomonas sp. 8E]|uniref:type II toxin-antitoxin system RelE/ParE family toxin n=1 Tax=Endozoicomonas sp. 8E TaxID=3035692 RepID=UPI0029390594|nr:type II toxin-antitoxin system RelE/ParE family toxin [Endozoicomonas sp. 8E]WOG26818.1 type II toxin-antitoxin system RelE/ParE family toxin [Endozoicomonas sp. 8E]
MQPAFVLTKKAKSDLLSIARYTSKQWGKAQRNLYLQQLDETFHTLAKHPDSGSPSDHVRTDYKKFPQGSHIIYYRIKPKGGVSIVRILHKSMDVNLQIELTRCEQ